LNKEGISLGINSSYSQDPCRWDHRGHNDYDWWATREDGTREYNIPCLLDPKLDVYLKEFYSLLAGIKPDYIYVDDDHRYMLVDTRGTWGCFCDLHLKKFSELTHIKWTREALTSALKSGDTSVRRHWIEFLGERLVQISRLIAESVHAVAPEVEVGLMVPGVHPLPTVGHTIINVLEAFKGLGKSVVRPCIGPYADRDRRQIIPGFYYTEYIRHLLGDDIEYTPEIETSGLTRISKGCTAIRYHITQAVLNRMNNPAITVCGYTGNSPYFEPAYVDLLKTSKAFFEEVRRIAPERGTRKGIQCIWDFDAPKDTPRKVNNVKDLFWPAFELHDILGNSGFATTYDESPVRFLAGDTPYSLSKERLSGLLKGGLVLDAHAAAAFVARGFRDEIGCEIAENLTYFASEKCISETFFGSYADTYITLKWVQPSDSVFRLKAQDKTEVISYIADPDLKQLAPGVILFENVLGGKVAVLPYSLTGCGMNLQHFIIYQRRCMFRNIFNWMAPEAVPLFVEEPADFAVQVWDNGKRMTGCITNISYDIAHQVRIAMVDGTISPGKALYISDNGDMEPLSDKIKVLTSSKNKTLWRIKHEFPIFKPFIMILER